MKKKPSRPASAPEPVEEHHSPRILLGFVLVSGAVLMSLEIAGSRVLAPYFGSSAFVWGSLIGIFLGALSIGYKVGGMLADRWPHRWMLAAAGAGAGLLILLVPVLADPVCSWADGVGMGPRYAPLVSSLVLFLAPSALLGVVSPFAIKLASQSITRIGNVAGTLYSLSTVGSIVGTIGTAFYLIPWLGLRSILLTIGLLQIAVSVVLLASSRRDRIPMAAAGIVVGLLLAEGAP